MIEGRHSAAARVRLSPWRPNRSVALGRMLNAFFGWGVLPRTEVTIGKVNLVSGQDEGPATIAAP